MALSEGSRSAGRAGEGVGGVLLSSGVRGVRREGRRHVPRTEKQGRVKKMTGKPHLALACETFTQTKQGRQLGLGTGCAGKRRGLVARTGPWTSA